MNLTPPPLTGYRFVSLAYHGVNIRFIRYKCSLNNFFVVEVNQPTFDFRSSTPGDFNVQAATRYQWRPRRFRYLPIFRCKAFIARAMRWLDVLFLVACLLRLAAGWCIYLLISNNVMVVAVDRNVLETHSTWQWVSPCYHSQLFIAVTRPIWIGTYKKNS